MKNSLHGLPLKKGKIFSLVMLLAALTTQQAWAQVKISGKVLEPSGEGAIGANVVEKGTSNGTITDIEGNFSLEVTDENVSLLISYVGYTDKEVPLNGQTSLEITLEEDVKALEEVVVVGYGVQKKSVVTGAIASVKPEEIQQSPIARVEEALQGRTAGVQVASNSGQPGSGLTVRVRGTGSLNNSDPLYIVDGVPTGGMDFLNPSDIESIEVLKDAASAAIYGTRAANGVVLITTKQGKAGKTQVSYDMYYGVQNPWKKVSLLNATEYANILNEASVNDGNLPLFDDPSAFGKGTDWQDEIFNYNAPIMNHQITISGGNDKSTFSASGAYFGQEGIVGNSDKSYFDRYSFRLNSNHKLSEKITFGQNLSYTHILKSGLVDNQEFDSPIARALNMDPTIPVYDEDGNFALPRSGFQEVVNPVASIDITNQEFTLDKIFGNFYGEYEILKGLKFRSNFGLDLAFGDNREFIPIHFLSGTRQSPNAIARRRTERWYTWLWENTLSYQRTVGKHDFTGLLGMSAQQDTYMSVFAQRSNSWATDFDNAFVNSGDASTAMSEGAATDHTLQSFFGRVNYAFADKYLLTGTVRMDGSSNFGPNNRYAIFPSVSAGWVFSEEDFFKNSGLSNTLNFAKLRASWGQNGNERIPGNAYSSVVDTYGRGYTFGMDPTLHVGASPQRMDNPDLKWETSEQIDIGVDLGLFDDRLTISADYYNKKTKDMLMLLDIMGYVGLEAPWANGADVLNDGVEFGAEYRSSVGELNFSIGANAAYNRNEVTFINNNSEFIPGAGIGTMGVVSRATVGMPIGYFYGYKTDGLWQSQEEIDQYDWSSESVKPKPGDLRFVKEDGTYGEVSEDDKTFIGKPTPDWTFGLNISADYKGFDFVAFFQGAAGFQIYNATRRADLKQVNMPGSWLDRWTPDNTNTTMPRATLDDPNGNYSNISDFYVEDGDYIRLRTIQLGYTLPERLSLKAGMSKIRVYVSADNLFTLTKYSGLDPEIGFTGGDPNNLNSPGNLNLGIDRGYYPQARTFRVGANISF
ncbi:TonB-dependent receptor [Cytophagales bacterium RKSG123]|nr:TonB-dependent receptor [Xanthovirga aplysinae]